MPKVKAPGISISPLTQETRETCWYTGYRMLWIWKGLDDPGPVTKQRDSNGNIIYVGGGDIKDKLTANDDKTNAPIIDWVDACTSGLKMKDYLKAAKALGLHARACGTGLTLPQLQEYLRISPVWVGGNWSGFNHVVVVMEASENKVTFADPWSDVGIADTTDWDTNFFLFGKNYKTDSNGNVTGPGNPQGAYYQRGWFQFQRF
jgi:Papain-like cysteine protease AvrRpt2